MAPDEPNYLRRLCIILGSLFLGFTLVVLSGWQLIYNPGSGDAWWLWSLRRVPLVLGVVLLLTGFVLLRKPVGTDPSLPEDDVDNMDGA
ncbi:hypothetical protein [Acetobacter oeni]|uniref:DUF3098 domain-containing protein n=1 Tax=Acetobacter oeni TaxID=304077 RepID=A0A511XI70_9PROT|nr:hypothetical protein [Acetobacter oeni]MBB3883055.1 preprotein translocase subunit SecG [Acetobacter oeni]NHO19131.1 hypothetical protein [Acetobacter oeni]GBR11533.1 hypothetical protein AA21952_3382 [Acetobacter oeni LMG 21952]GEN62640.1 hypothetical protein AOE01nite_08640 [Acetobacter oeni]